MNYLSPQDVSKERYGFHFARYVEYMKATPNDSIRRNTPRRLFLKTILNFDCFQLLKYDHSLTQQNPFCENYAQDGEEY